MSLHRPDVVDQALRDAASGLIVFHTGLGNHVMGYARTTGEDITIEENEALNLLWRTHRIGHIPNGGGHMACEVFAINTGHQQLGEWRAAA